MGERGLFAGDVTALEKGGAQKPVDVITVRVVETFKGPGRWRTAPSRCACRAGTGQPARSNSLQPARASWSLTNPNSEVMLVPLSTAYAEKLRAIRGQGPQLVQQRISTLTPNSDNDVRGGPVDGDVGAVEEAAALRGGEKHDVGELFGLRPAGPAAGARPLERLLFAETLARFASAFSSFGDTPGLGEPGFRPTTRTPLAA